jgi:hypothetical protein
MFKWAQYKVRIKSFSRSLSLLSLISFFLFGFTAENAASRAALGTGISGLILTDGDDDQ